MNKHEFSRRMEAFAAAVPRIEQVIGYRFTDPGLLTQAFTTPAFCNEVPPPYKARVPSYQVLEFLGDSVLYGALAADFMERFTTRGPHGLQSRYNEGDFSVLKRKLSDKTNLSCSMESLGLAEHLLLGNGRQINDSIREDLFEAILGAVFADAGGDLATVKAVVARMLDASVYFRADAVEKDPKSLLQEYCADKQRRLPAPRYCLLSKSGPDNAPLHRVGCYIGEVLYGEGEDGKKSRAEAQAAGAALLRLQSEQI